MNDFRLVDAVMPDVAPPDPAKAAEARARVLGGRRRRSVPRWAGVLTAATATAAVIGAVAVVAVPSLGGGPAGPAVTVTRVNAEEVLAAAADRLARRPEATGRRYWRGETEEVVRRRIGVAGHTFLADERVGQTTWLGPGRKRTIVISGLGTRPVTAADRAEWRKAGSPRLCGADTDCDNDMVPDGKTRYIVSDTEEVLQQGALELNGREIRDLPRDPAALRERLLSYWPAQWKAMKKNVPAQVRAESAERDDWLWGIGESLLLGTPATPGTRAAIYRMLAGLPRARVVDGIRDADGRAGVAVLRGDGRGEPEKQLVVDRETGEPLAVQQVSPAPAAGQERLPVNRLYSRMVKRLGWTDDEPVVPKGCDPDGKKDCLR
ncbi:CU044_5270 family protein [Streptosporangium sp. NPDC004379]|uniref:CU044_5270 family protein n=1 Tax=Streptosporangium sp. NPDC004379 TaxID=3366189 RepID=UPI003697B5D7